MHVANSSFFLVLILDIVIAHVVLITIVIVSRNGILFLLHDVEFCYLLFGYLHAIWCFTIIVELYLWYVLFYYI